MGWCVMQSPFGAEGAAGGVFLFVLGFFLINHWLQRHEQRCYSGPVMVQPSALPCNCGAGPARAMLGQGGAETALNPSPGAGL